MKITNSAKSVLAICRYLSIPASLAAVERLFSTCGALIRARRARLTAKTVESLLFRMEGQRL